jgi:hypothetical protein
VGSGDSALRQEAGGCGQFDGPSHFFASGPTVGQSERHDIVIQQSEFVSQVMVIQQPEIVSQQHL